MPLLAELLSVLTELRPVLSCHIFVCFDPEFGAEWALS